MSVINVSRKLYRMLEDGKTLRCETAYDTQAIFSYLCDIHTIGYETLDAIFCVDSYNFIHLRNPTEMNKRHYILGCFPGELYKTEELTWYIISQKLKVLIQTEMDAYNKNYPHKVPLRYTKCHIITLPLPPSYNPNSDYVKIKS